MHLMSRNIYISVVTIAKPTDQYTGDRDHDETEFEVPFIQNIKACHNADKNQSTESTFNYFAQLCGFFFSHYEEDDENPYNRIESIKLIVKDNVF